MSCDTPTTPPPAVKRSSTTPDDNVLAGNFESLTNIDDIRECLRQLDQEETRIDASLDQLLSQESALVEQLGRLDLLR